jgi:hypothetical protein
MIQQIKRRGAGGEGWIERMGPTGQKYKRGSCLIRRPPCRITEDSYPGKPGKMSIIVEKKLTRRYPSGTPSRLEAAMAYKEGGVEL